MASEFGRVFSVAGLAAIFPVAGQVGRIGKLLVGLAGSNLVTREAGAGPDDYAFSHALVQEAIYDLLPLAQSKRQHRRIADWLEEQHAGLMAGYHGVLARHCMLADEFPRAVDHLEGGASTALRHSAYREAIQHIETAQRLADERRLAADALGRARWHSLLGDGRDELSEVGPARAAYLKTLELLDRAYAPGALARAGGILAQLGRQMLAGGRAPAPLPAAQAEASRLASHAHAQLSEIILADELAPVPGFAMMGTS